eukprot:CAMPEP_0178917334 /NCGR_PEP_ID=MMETSP0786-20121207/13189_1 /TAXON_ID=186022 /ORGANISM="Thalassionema frauenfeldii, Strain CCMP 1798" /LENGTH=163 /DNA_ID=CAMNT_0020590873 /DNA_START=3190 /DNA_END=3681 /DNA_ORIENTATION=+
MTASDDATTDTNNRRSFLLLGGMATAALSSSSPAAWADIPAEDYSNEFIQTLKARSDSKRDVYTKEARDGNIAWKKLNTAKFSNQYARPKFTGVERADKSFQMVTPEELETLKSQDKIYEDYTTFVDSDGKEKIDYARGTIYKFKESSSASSRGNNEAAIDEN